MIYDERGARQGCSIALNNQPHCIVAISLNHSNWGCFVWTISYQFDCLRIMSRYNSLLKWMIMIVNEKKSLSLKEMKKEEYRWMIVMIIRNSLSDLSCCHFGIYLLFYCTSYPFAIINNWLITWEMMFIYKNIIRWSAINQEKNC